LSELFFGCDFRCLMKSLMIGPIRGADFKNQSAILLLAVLNRLFG